ncbi:hypothetical protein SPYCA_3515 [Sphingopyxis sp. FD7]|nr:hypothetical protein SPYCA_3515 [Sphingopyxis sp. FD7]
MRGSASGAVGKAQPPPPGQTLLFGKGTVGMGSNPLAGFGMVAPVVGIALQEFLRKIRIVMVPVLIRSRLRPP